MKQSDTQKPSKRNDLQGLRGLAVIFVVLFHYFTDVFPNGYLGIDLSFIIYGLLACQVLEQSNKKPPLKFVLTFLARRFRTIVPLYLLITLLISLGILWLLPTSSFIHNRQSALKALSFFSNQPDIGDDDYFEKLSLATDFFTHTWAISAEMQFYVLIPFIYLDINKFRNSKIQMALYSTVALLSFLFYISSSPMTSFYSIFSRMWQFSIGMIVYLLSTDVKTSPKYQLLPERLFNTDFLSPYKTLILGSLIYVATYSISFPSFLFRSLFTLASGLLMMLSPSDKFLCNPILSYIGTISYTLYLVHWPIYAYWKFEMESSFAGLFVPLTLSVLFSIAIHETFERWYLKLSPLQVVSLIAILFTLNISVIFKDELLIENGWTYDQFDKNVTLEDPESMNRIWNTKDWVTLNIPDLNLWEGWNYRKNLPLEGTSKIMIVGSSSAANIASLIQEECQQKAKIVLQGTYAACEPLYPTSSGSKCSSRLDEFQENFQKEQPDYAFMAARHLDMGAPFPQKVNKLEHDPTFIFAREQLRIYAEHTKKKLFLLNPLPRINPKNMEKIATMVKENRVLEEIDKLIVNFDGYEMANLRFEKLLEDCGEKCAPIDFTKEFIEEKSGNFRYFNFLGFSYFTKEHHLTPFGLTRVRHLFREVCRSL